MNNTIIILGWQINQDGTLPDPAKTRVDKGVEYFKNGNFSRVIMSGKYALLKDFHGNIPLQSEAEAMKEYAMTLGVNEEVIFIEKESKDTVGNAYYTKTTLLEPNNWKTVTVVTSDFHLERAKIIFDLILGKEYTITYESTPTGLSNEEMEIHYNEEAKLTRILRKAIDEASFSPNMYEELQKHLTEGYLEEYK